MGLTIEESAEPPHTAPDDKVTEWNTEDRIWKVQYRTPNGIAETYSIFTYWEASRFAARCRLPPVTIYRLVDEWVACY